jgi:hypothetical protein
MKCSFPMGLLALLDCLRAHPDIWVAHSTK